MEDLTQLIGNVGFPIAAFVMMYYMCNTTLKENTRAVVECTKLIHKIRTDNGANGRDAECLTQ